MRIALSALLTITAVAAPRGQENTPAKLGVFLWHDSPNDLATLSGIRLGLRQSGLPHTFVEHHAKSDAAKARAALDELQRERCDLVLALGTQSALLAKEAITDVPIVFGAVSDPVASGVVRDWSGTGSNVCGASNWIGPQEVLAVFRLAVPHLQRLGVIRSRTSGVVSAAEVANMRAHLAAGRAPGLSVHESVAEEAADVERAVQGLLAEGVDAIWIPIDITIYQNVPAVQRAVGSRAVPLLTTAAAGVHSGAHVGTVVDYELHGRRVAHMALQVLSHGAAPGSLPVDRMTSRLVTVNLAAARQAGVDLPLSLLVLADELHGSEEARDSRPR